MLNGSIVAMAVGVALGILYTLSPMSVWLVVGGGVLLWIAARGLPPRERRWIVGLIVVAVIVRVAMVAGLFLFGTPDRIYVPFSVFFGDEQYMIVRSLRDRAIWLGATMKPDAFSEAFEIYGRTSYLQVLALLQLLVGPAPYGVHLFNILMFVAGGIVLHRIVRHAFGPAAAMGSLAFLLFLPSLVLWSTAALKESFNFFVVVSTLGAVVLMVRAPLKWRPLAALGALGGLAVLGTLRDGALEIALAGLAVALASVVLTKRAWRLTAALVLLIVVTPPLLRMPRVHAAAMQMVRTAAAKHMGHAYTRGHSYELLESEYYGRRNLHELTNDEAVRFIERGVASMVIFPAPWQMRSRAELVYLPEQIVWYIVVFTGAIGVVAGFRRDRLVTSLFAGYAAVALIAVGVNSGNFGTLVRHRMFGLPYVGALSAFGIVVLVARFGSVRQGGYGSDR